MDGPRDYHTRKSKSGKEHKYNMISLMCGIYFKNDTNELIYKTEADIKNKLMVAKGKRKEG